MTNTPTPDEVISVAYTASRALLKSAATSSDHIMNERTLQMAHVHGMFAIAAGLVKIADAIDLQWDDDPDPGEEIDLASRLKVVGS